MIFFFLVFLEAPAPGFRLQMEIFDIHYLKKALQPSSLYNNKALKHNPSMLEMRSQAEWS